MAQKSRGRISTYFSYKGGVGRTMALANVAFLSALDGARVLMMDWDLEAPGLQYYFRGLMEDEDIHGLVDAEGILDLAWRWKTGIDEAENDTDITAHFNRFTSGETFAACARPIMGSNRTAGGKGCLHLIKAGSDLVEAAGPLPYPEALSRFSWQEFFDSYVGGHCIHALREWAIANYDIILIDSRTGYADVAGICTMQLPDSVVLCFVPNNQNADGIVKVAASIRATRGDEVSIRIAPMRIADLRENEYSDVQFRVLRELKQAGLDLSNSRDMRNLAIPAFANLPSQEALAAFSASDPMTDPPTSAYRRMMGELTGRSVTDIVIDSSWRDEVNSRLRPTLATLEYLRNLEHADGDRAVAELNIYLAAALRVHPSTRDLDPDYVRALIECAANVLEYEWDDDQEANRLLDQRMIALLERHYAYAPAEWAIDLVDALDASDSRRDTHTMFDVERLRQRDAILVTAGVTPGVLQRRIDLLLRIVNIESSSEALLEQLNEIESLIDVANGFVGPGQDVPISRYAAQLELRRARALQDLGEWDAARNVALKGIQVCDGATLDRSMAYTIGELLIGLAFNPTVDKEATRRYLVEASRVAGPILWQGPQGRYERIVAALLSTSRGEREAARFVEYLFRSTHSRGSVLPARFRMSIGDMAEYAEPTSLLLDAIAKHPGKNARENVDIVARATIKLMQDYMRRRKLMRRDPSASRVGIVALAHLAESLFRAGASEDLTDEYAEILNRLEHAALGTSKG
ncbi:KGGVGR-motif variant AAA ATPase [Sphingobium yanoikuyae]|uniref:KGGVGR-motif variant AAA ATPase n=1 Tax=Sphingobium yanoikuyae TaxID=13690 RepID=UPI00345E6DC8